LLEQAETHQEKFVEILHEWRDRIGFSVAEPLEPLHVRPAIATAPAAHTVVATDGSQIAPSHHEIAYCYLINIGRIVLHYGQNRYPLLDGLPEVFYRSEDLYQSRQWGIRTEEWMGLQRTVSEVVELADLAIEATDASPDYPPVPNLAMVDGSLIYWFLEPLPNDARDRLLPPMLAAWEKLRQARIPLVGYLSASRSREVLNFLRLQLCGYATPDCMTHCAGQTDTAPCHQLVSLRDTVLWMTQLQPGERSPIFRSSARILDLYGEDHRVHFCYIHVGTEIARLEFPAWVFHDPQLLDTALTLTIAQVQKGYGYPVALAEAHNQAVVRGGDRARFFALLERQMIQAGLTNISTSYKETRKRGSIA
ncbi:MAG: DNA double-strand break repair nuclease NurA, partial [Leptolyngbyaceae bacterium]|nr:DNA double-strand break repair nuclease NurA [Leptolyngbyaceae bacterium]